MGLPVGTVAESVSVANGLTMYACNDCRLALSMSYTAPAGASSTGEPLKVTVLSLLSGTLVALSATIGGLSVATTVTEALTVLLFFWPSLITTLMLRAVVLGVRELLV